MDLEMSVCEGCVYNQGDGYLLPSKIGPITTVRCSNEELVKKVDAIFTDPVSEERIIHLIKTEDLLKMGPPYPAGNVHVENGKCSFREEGKVRACSSLESCNQLVSEHEYRHACTGRLKLALCPLANLKYRKLPREYKK